MLLYTFGGPDKKNSAAVDARESENFQLFVSAVRSRGEPPDLWPPFNYKMFEKQTSKYPT